MHRATVANVPGSGFSRDDRDTPAAHRTLQESRENILRRRCAGAEQTWTRALKLVELTHGRYTPLNCLEKFIGNDSLSWNFCPSPVALAFLTIDWGSLFGTHLH